MNTTSASPAEAAGAPRAATPDDKGRVLVWDAPLRVFHWLMVLCFAGAWLSAESERWRLLHVSLGYTMAGLLVFRLLWGLAGTRHARFASFVRGPAKALDYARGVLRGQPARHIGHNPAHALAILAVLGVAALVTASGIAAYQEWGPEALGEVHEVVANLLMGLVLLHLVGVALTSWMHRENLVRAMVDGRKAGRPEDGIGRSARTGLAVLLVVAVLGFWAWQWQGAPGAAGGAPLGSSAAQAGAGAGHHGGHRGHDDDD